MRTLLVALMLSTSLHAGVSLITGQIKDAQGNPINGTLVMRLPIPAQDPATQSAIANVPVTFSLINGQVTGGAPLYDLSTIQPGKLWYSARAYDTTGSLVFYGNYYVTGPIFNIGAATPTVVTTSNISFAQLPTGSSGFGTPVPAGNTIQSTINAIATAGSGAPIIVPQGFTGSGNYTNPAFLPILNFTPSPNGDYDKNGVRPVDIFGVRHDGQAAACTTVAGNPQITCSSQPNLFTQADVGKLVLAYGVGPAATGGVESGLGPITASGGSGGTPGVQSLISTNGGCQYPIRGWVTVAAGGSISPGSVVTTWISGYGCTSAPTTATVATVTGSITLTGVSVPSADLPTTIASVQSGNTITLSDTPSVSTTTHILYGTDDQAALQAACNGHVLGQNGGHYTHSGISMLSKGVVCDGNNVWIQGAGWAPLGNSGGGSNLVYAGKNLGDGIWISSQGWGAKLTDMGLRGNSFARPRGLVISKGHTPLGTGNSALGIFQRLWIGWMYGDGVGPANLEGFAPALSKGIFADAPGGNGDFNTFDDIFINAAVQGVDGNNDQATEWTFSSNLEIQNTYVGFCEFNESYIRRYFTEFNAADIQLSACDVGSLGAPVGLTIDEFDGESSAQNIVFGTTGVAANSPSITVHYAGLGLEARRLDPSGNVVDISGPINSGSIILGDYPSAFSIGAGVKLPAFGNTGFGPKITLNTNNLPSNIITSASTCGTICTNAEPTPFTYNGKKLLLGAADYAATPVPWMQNDFEGSLRNFGSVAIASPRSLGQTDNVSTPFYGVTGGQTGATGSTVYNYQVTCSDQAGNEAPPAPTVTPGFPWQIQTADGVVIRFTTGPTPPLTTANSFSLSWLWANRGCAYYNFYGDEGSGSIGYLTTITSTQFFAQGNVFTDQGQYTKTARVPPPLNSTASGGLTVEGPTSLGRLKIADKGTCTMAAGTCGAITFPSGATYIAAPTCFATYTGTGTLAGTIKISSTTTTVTPASTTGTDTAQVNWACLGN